VDDKDLFEQLRSGPFSREGFDEKLRRKINENLDNPRRGARRPSFLRLSAIGASFIVIVGAIFAMLSWDDFSAKQKSEELSISMEPSASAALSDDQEEANRIPHSAVVIGLRKDDAKGARSSYRTIVVAPENKQLIVIGSGEGIWMPHKQNFWQIEALEDPLGKGDQTLVATNKGSKTETRESAEIRNDKNASKLRRTEKLLFAGDSYVTVLQTTNVDEKGGSVKRSEVFTNLLPTLASANRAANANALEEENVTLNEALGTGDPLFDVERWAIVRESNAWVAKEAPSSSKSYSAGDETSWPTLSVRLENTNVVKDKPLAISWEEAKRLDPEAVDAYTSQDGDVAVLVSNERIQLVPYRLPESERKSVTIDKAPNESVVMVQWAIQEQYVENWKRMFKEWFSDSAR